MLPLWLLLTFVMQDSVLCIQSPPPSCSPDYTPKAAVPDTCPGKGLLKLPTTEKPQLLGDSQFHFQSQILCMRGRQTDGKRWAASTTTVVVGKNCLLKASVSSFERMGIRFTSRGCCWGITEQWQEAKASCGYLLHDSATGA